MTRIKALDDTLRLMMMGELKNYVDVKVVEDKTKAFVRCHELRIDNFGTDDPRVVLTSGGYDLFEVPLKYSSDDNGCSVTIYFDDNDDEQFIQTKIEITS